MRVLLAGRGDVSVVHVAAISALGAELVGVCDSTSDYRAMLSALRPDVVHVCTPHDTHVPIALEALAHGAHVLLEKPVAHTIEEAAVLVDALADFPDLQVGVCLQNRYNATSRAASQFLQDQDHASVRGGSATVLWHRDAAYYAKRPWRGERERSGGGVLINQAIHTIDLLQWLLGEVSQVSGHSARMSDIPGIDVEDTANLLLDHVGGARSVVFATVTNAVDSPVTIEIATSSAVLHLRGDLTITHDDGRVEVVAEPRSTGEGRDYWGASHQLLIADFYRAISSGEPFGITPADALKSQKIIDEIYRKGT
ncbi:Gfo/Idh/MocA family oxidoreductase [Actinoplanes sp. KI2]|uniref:Gfo/Idh/MocA family protein n=1 Tax=Actinoplanes sp. KI2 TaxID=2983315 RepID=UPI0021D5A7E3|nr:Gfo/Idh/MocA family oxidoreductase [Actinoplanes sp. KI2]MCU7730844.1 Gfo/Idh/MocA family oxidoreductase [Actinoplanes sp. KI2]